MFTRGGKNRPEPHGVDGFPGWCELAVEGGDEGRAFEEEGVPVFGGELPLDIIREDDADVGDGIEVGLRHGGAADDLDGVAVKFSNLG